MHRLDPLAKEFCDLLVVFDNNVLVFSDKDIGFSSGNLEVVWPRWYRKAVQSSLKQLRGAKQWITDQKDLYLDNGCTKLLPLPLPARDDAKIHQIAIARGAGPASKAYFGEGLGTLMLESHDTQLDVPDAFCLIQPGAAEGLVHVFDDVGLELIMSNLDTVRDFVDYLERRRELFTGRFVHAAGEEELLGLYLRDVGPDGRHAFLVDPRLAAAETVCVDGGWWKSLSKHPQRLAQLEADEPSYLWDDLISRFAQHILNDTQFGSTDPANPFAVEPALRFLAREPRTRRRMLARGLLEVAHALNPSSAWKVRVAEPSSAGDPLYVLMVSNQPNNKSYEDYRRSRQEVLMAYVRCAKLVCPGATHIVGLAISHWDSQDASEDLICLDTSEWTTLDFETTRVLQEETGYLKNLSRTEWVEKTYPDTV